MNSNAPFPGNKHRLNTKKAIMKIKSTIKKLSFIFLVSTLSFSCTKAIYQTDNVEPEPTFFIENKTEKMPVWVYGKEDSKYIILPVHGGPGSEALDFRNYKGGIGFRTIEDDYLVAYWQQRASGQSSGVGDESLFTIDQYVDDADKVIDELKALYPDTEIILFGHSWGGMLTSSYLGDTQRSAKVKAWVNAAGVHNGTTIEETTLDDINNEADKRIEADVNVDYWNDVKQELKDNADKANALAYEVVNKIPEVPIKVDNSEFNFELKSLLSNKVLFPQILKTNNTSILASGFELPTLILWGDYDFAVSKTIRDEALQNLSSAKVTNVNFHASGHYMMFHEPELFANSMKDFIAKL